MSIDRAYVYRSIDSERDHQAVKWGERPHEVGAWLTIMRTLLSEAEVAWAKSSGDHAALVEIRKVIAVGVACAEQHGLPFRSRHEPIERMRT